MSRAPTPDSLQPSQFAESLFDLMRDSERVQREILAETLISRDNGNILESGRTVCNSPRQVRGPLGRFPTAVELQTCPIGGGGAWHTHVTTDQLANPHNSLPDMAYVALGSLDVMGVVGTESAEYMLAAADRDAMEAEFADAIGEDVRTPPDVVEALETGRIPPRAARDRVRKRLSGLFREVETELTDIPTEELSPLPEPVREGPYEQMELAMVPDDVPYHRLMATPGGVGMATSNLASQLEAFISEDLPGDVAGTLVGTTVGTITGKLVERLVFGN